MKGPLKGAGGPTVNLSSFERSLKGPTQKEEPSTEKKRKLPRKEESSHTTTRRLKSSSLLLSLRAMILSE